MTHPSYNQLDAARDDIRLLDILPARPDQPEVLDCSLRTVSLSDDLNYVALSYVWGDGNSREDIVMDDHPISVTTSLSSGLKACRDKFGAPLTLWADALCINQEDLNEKTHQIGQMGRIFSQAAAVVAWVGEEADNSDRAIDEIGKLSKMLEDHYQSPWSVRKARSLQENHPRLGGVAERVALKAMRPVQIYSWIKDMPEVTVRGPSGTTADSLSKPNWSSITRRAVNAFTTRPYWSRVWTFQELVLAREIVILCGSKGLAWAPITWMALYGTIFSTRMGEMKQSEKLGIAAGLAVAGERFLSVTTMQEKYREGIVPTLSAVTEIIWNRKTTDPRDMVYGVLALAQTDMLSDYSRSLEDIYRQVTIEKMQLAGMLDNGSHSEKNAPMVKPIYLYPIYLAALGRQRQDGLCSWVEDFSSGLVPDHLPPNCLAAGSTGIRAANATVEGNSLHLHGCCVGEIKRAWKVTEDTLEDDLFFIIKAWFRDSCISCPKDGRVFDMLRDVLLLGCGTEFHQVTRNPIDPGSREDHIMMRCFLMFVRSIFRSETTLGLATTIREHIDERVSQLPSRFHELDKKKDQRRADFRFLRVDVPESYLCYTTEGTFVSATRVVQPGDLLYIIAGHPCPVVLRKSDAHFRLLTWAYVHGVMRGELVGEDEEAWLSSLEKLKIR